MSQFLQQLKNHRQDKPPLWTANFLLICFSTLSIVFTFHSLTPTLPHYVEIFGGTTQMAGLPLASLTVAAILSRPVTGWALDKYGRKKILLAGIVLFLIPMVLFIWLIPVVMLIALRFVQGLGWGVSNTAAGTVASDIVPRERIGEGMGYYSLTLSISMAVSPVTALWLINQYSFRELFIVCSVLTILSLVLALFIKYPVAVRPVDASTRFVFMEKTALRPAAVIIFFTLSYSSLASFLPLYAYEQGLETTGLFFTAMAVTTLICRPLSGLIVDRMGQKGFNLCVLTGLITSIAGMPVLAQISSLGHLLAGGALFGIGLGLLQPTMLALSIINAPPEKKGAANATYWTAVDMGAASGSMFWGLVAAAFGFKTLFNLTIIPLVIALVLYFSWRSIPAKLSEEETT